MPIVSFDSGSDVLSPPRHRDSPAEPEMEIHMHRDRIIASHLAEHRRHPGFMLTIRGVRLHFTKMRTDRIPRRRCVYAATEEYLWMRPPSTS